MKHRILIGSAGSLVSDAILRCLASRRDDVTIIGVNSVAAPLAFACDRLHRVPPTADAAAYAAAMRAIIRRERPAIILPGRDEDVPALAALAATGDFPDTVFAVPPPSLAPVFFDKASTHRFARDHGLPFAPTAEGAAAGPSAVPALAERCGYPLLAKPRTGAGSRDVVLLRDAADLVWAGRDARLLVQAFLGSEVLDGQWERFRRSTAPGMPWRWAFEDIETTAELTIGADGAVSTLCVDRGTTAPPLRTAVRVMEDAAVASVGLAWARVLAAHGHRGVVNIQGKKLADGRFIPYEIGARFGGTSVARAMLGHNQVLHLVAEVLGWPVPRLAGLPGSVGLEERRMTVPAGWMRLFDELGIWEAETCGDADGFRSTLHPRRDASGDHRRDRMAMADHARRHNLPFAATAATVEDAAAMLDAENIDAGRPVVAKPRWGSGPARLLDRWADVVAVLAGGDSVVQPCLDADTVAPQLVAWNSQPAPWGWRVSDNVETAEAEIGPDGRLSPIRTALCVQRGGEPVEIRPTQDRDVAASFHRWADSLVRDGHRGPLRITGKRDARGAWLPFSVSQRPLDLPQGDVVEMRFLVPAGSSTE